MSQNPKFKIVFASAAGSQSTSKRGRGRGTTSRINNDLEQAINSITYVDSKAKTNNIGQTSAEKLVFTPKWVQKKVAVIRDSPKKIAIPQPSSSRIPNVSPSGPLMKKKKLLGDLALQSGWDPQKKPIEEEKKEPENAIESPTVLCRVCGALIEDTVVDIIDDSGSLTVVGKKLKTVVGPNFNDSPLYPPACCKACSFKINVCYSLLVELQSSDEVVRCTYEDLQEGDLVNPSAHIYTCPECKQEVVGMKDFIAHCENHARNKTIGPEKVVVTPKKDEGDGTDIFAEGQAYLEKVVEDGSILYQNEADGEDVYSLHDTSSTEDAASDEDYEKEIVKKRIKRKEERKLACCYCCEYVPKSSLLKHLTEKHDRGRYVCEFCDQNFAFKSHLKIHSKKHVELTKDLKEIYINFCHICSEQFDSETLCRDHMKNLHQIEIPGSGTVYGCLQCHKPFSQFFKLKVHLLMYHDVHVSAKLGRHAETECHVCNEVFLNENKARIHMANIHHLDKKDMDSTKQECEECGRLFNRKFELLEHVYGVHLKIRIYECEFCKTRFTKASSLIFHRFRHTGVKNYRCATCGVSFRQRNDVMRHLARHVRDKEETYEEAHAINDSTSDHVTKRIIYLKDSTIKGLKEMANKKSSRKYKKKETLDSPNPKSNEDSFECETKEEVVSEEFVVDENGDLVEKHVSGNLDEVVSTTEEIREELEEGNFIQYTLEGDNRLVSPDGTRYDVHENENGQMFIIKSNG